MKNELLAPVSRALARLNLAGGAGFSLFSPGSISRGEMR